MAEYTIFIRLNGVEVKANCHGGEIEETMLEIKDILTSLPTTRWQRLLLWIKGIKL